MDVSTSLAGSGRSTFACSVAAYGVVEAALGELPALRDQPGSSSARPIPPRFLRYADEQTVVGLAAVLRAIDAHPLRDACFDEWGVLAAPRFLGRVVGAATFTKFIQNPQAAVSPHIIPQHSLHSVAGAISIALGMHGPNFGVGGGPEALAEGLTAGLTFLEYGSVPGLWLVLTQWTPEPAPNPAGLIADDLVCRGVAMALVRGADHGCVLRLSDGPIPRHAESTRQTQHPQLTGLAAHLRGSADPGPHAPWSCPMPWGGRVEVVWQQQQQLKAA
jgi:hypothetical protein